MTAEADHRDAGTGELLLPLPEARRHVLSAVRALPVERVPLAAALGSVTAEAVTSPRPVPSFANSSMDGYAVRASDTASAPVRLRVVGEILAGHTPDLTVGPGEAARIMTGAPLPDGADAVVMVEHTRRHGVDAVTIESGVDQGASVRRPGEDIAAGQIVFEAGTELEPARIGVLASLGLTEATVHRRPVVGVLSTGDELATGTGEPAGAQIRDANRPMLLGLLERSGFASLDLGVAGDNEEAISGALCDAATRCDAIVTTGGVSMGDVDYVRVVLEKLTAGQARWMKVAIKPAKPFVFGLLAESGVPVFGLAGNPVSAVVGFELYTRPALRAMAGHRRPDRPVVRAIATEGIDRGPDGKLHLVRVTVTADDDGMLHTVPSGGQGSHMLLATARSNAFALVPDGDGIEAGDPVEVLLTGADHLGGRSVLLGDAGVLS